MKKSTINESIKNCTIIKNVAVAATLFFAVDIVALAGEPAPGEEAMSLVEFLISEAICIGAAAITGTVWVRANQRIQYLQDKKNRY